MAFGRGKDKPKDDKEDSKDESAIRLKPNRTLYILPHNGMTKTIQILDLTTLIKSTYPSPELEKECKEVAESSSPPPEVWLTISSTHWYSKNFTIEKRGEAGEIATWKGGMFSTSINTLTFPPNSAHSSHPIVLKADNFVKFREQFIKDSVTYQWKPENVVTMRNFTLTKIIGGKKLDVAKFWSGMTLGKVGGPLVLDAEEVDVVVAVVSMVNVIRKRRLKLYEYGG